MIIIIIKLFLKFLKNKETEMVLNKKFEYLENLENLNLHKDLLKFDIDILE